MPRAAASLVPIAPEPLAMFRAARGALVGLAAAFERFDLGYAPVDLLAEEHEEMHPVLTAVHGVVRTALSLVVPRSHQPPGTAAGAAAGARAMAELEAAVSALGPAAMNDEVWALRDSGREARSGLVRDIGLVAFSAHCRLRRPGGGEPVLSFEPLAPAAARAELLRRLLRRATQFTFSLHSKLLHDEMDASDWAFARWSTMPPYTGPKARRLAQERRSEEWSTVEHRAVALGTTVLGAMAARRIFAVLRPRQFALAEALARSTSGVFECTAVRDGMATLRELDGGRTLSLVEQCVPAPYGAGWLGFGRIIPLDDGRYMRSNGFWFVPPPREARAARLDEALALLDSSLPRTLAVEGALSLIGHGQDVPREFPTPIGVKSARESITRFHEAWRDFHGTPLGVPAPPLSDVLATWVGALEKAATGAEIDTTLDAKFEFPRRRRDPELELPDADAWYRDN